MEQRRHGCEMGVLKIIQREMDDVNAPSCYTIAMENMGKSWKITFFYIC